MSAWNHRCFWVAWLVMLATLLAGCGPKEIVDWPELRGRVYDKETGRPLEGAFVVANWEAHWAGTMGGGSSGCIHAEVARTDAQGGYVIPAWVNHAETNRANEQAIHLTVYMPGYRRVGDIFTLDEAAVIELAVEKSSSPPRERLKELDSIAGGIGCYPFQKNENDYAAKAIVPVNESLLQEVCALDAGNRYGDEKDVVAKSILYNLIRATRGDEYAGQHNDEGCAYVKQ